MKNVSGVFTILFLVIATLLSCGKASDVASGGSHLFLSADPSQIAQRGTSHLTVTGTDENGVPLPDGTKIAFTVDQAGRISPSTVQLLGGSATSTYFATVVAGDMTITATSGSIQGTTTINVGTELDQNVFVSANPATLPPGGGSSLISAVVTDGSGNPIKDEGVQFSTTGGTLQSNGGVIQTNENGLAIDTLNTTTSATVTATTVSGFSGQTTVQAGVGRIVCHMTVSSTTPKVGQTVLFFDTSDDPSDQIDTYHWEFGDGASLNAQNVQHVYNSAGNFNIVHSVTDQQGVVTACDPFPIQVSSN